MYCVLYQVGDFWEGVVDVEVFVFGGVVDQDFVIVFLCYVVVVGGQVIVQQLWYVFGEDDLVFYWFYWDVLVGGYFVEFCGLGVGGVDQGLVMQYFGIVCVYFVDLLVLVQYVGDVGFQ